jgi:hypothetical protein
LTRVDLPALGAPITATKPARVETASFTPPSVQAELVEALFLTPPIG